MENELFFKKQIITYLGNKRKILPYISKEVENITYQLNQKTYNICDLFSGSGIVARLLKQYSDNLYVNDLEKYSFIINDCYLTNKEDFDKETYQNLLKIIIKSPLREGIIAQHYAPKDDKHIQKGERCFYTHKNAILIDTYRWAIEEYVPDDYKKYFIAPLLYEASVHVNTSGVFKGFYKSKLTNIGKFGGDGGNALERITGGIELQQPIFSNYSSKVHLYMEDANHLAKKLKGLDITYIDPPYNQHPYGSNYFMLNTIVDNCVSEDISQVAGIPKTWHRSQYNQKNNALSSLEEIVSSIDSKYLIISYNNEGFITYNEMIEMLSKYGEVKIQDIIYPTFRGSRNLNNRNICVTEYLFVLKKKS